MDPLLTYARLDAELTHRFQQDFDRRYIRVDGRYYDRQEWARYLRLKRYWTRTDPTVEVPMPGGFR